MKQGDLSFFPDLSFEEEKVSRLIKCHVGRDQAIAVRALALQTGLAAKRVREVVRELIIRHGEPIGSTPGNPPGYYILSSQDEINRAYQSLLDRGKAIIFRASRLRQFSVDEVLGQIKFEFENNTPSPSPSPRTPEQDSGATRGEGLSRAQSRGLGEGHQRRG